MPAVTAPAFDAIYALQEAEICNVALGSIGAELIRNTDEDTKQARLCRTVYTQTRDELLRNYPFNFAVKTALVPEDTAYAYPMDAYTYAYKLLDYKTVHGTTSITTNPTIITAVHELTLTSDLIGRAISGTGIAAHARIIAIDATVGAQTITMDRAATAAAAQTDLVISIPMLKLNEIAANDNNIFDVVGGGTNRRVLCNIVSEVADSVNYLEVMYVDQIIDPAKFDSMFSHALSLRIASKIALDLTKDPRVVQMMQQEFSAIFQSAKISSSEERELQAPDPWWTDRTNQTTETTTRR